MTESTILKDCLKHMMDGLALLFDDFRNENVSPFLLVDGNDSRFDIDFLRCIQHLKTTGRFELRSPMARPIGKLVIQ